MRHGTTLALVALAVALSACGGPMADAVAQNGSPLPIDQIRLPPGFSISIYAYPVPNARQMARGDRGTIFVGSRQDGRVHAVVDGDGDGKAETIRVVASGLRMPSGVAFRDGSLWVSEVSRVLRFDGIEGRLDAPPEPVVPVKGLPDDRHHGWKFIGFGPDGKLYVPVGAPCNVCLRDPPYATIQRMNPDGSGRETFAEGVRNTVGFDFHPGTGELWFTDNGRDMMGDDRPPDELNHAPKPGLHFGFPYCHGLDIADPELGRRPCSQFVAPEMALGPHVAAIGMRFYRGQAFPPEWRDGVFIAEHGSWNRTNKIGYRISAVRIRDGAASDYRTFAEGWLQGESAWGRPADVLELPDGSLLVSDDEAGAIYRITYR